MRSRVNAKRHAAISRQLATSTANTICARCGIVAGAPKLCLDHNEGLAVEAQN